VSRSADPDRQIDDRHVRALDEVAVLVRQLAIRHESEEDKESEDNPTEDGQIGGTETSETLFQFIGIWIVPVRYRT